MDALGVLGISAPTSNTLDARIVEEYIRSHAMVEGLRERYAFNEAYARFSLDPLSILPPGADRERATRFWRDKVRVRHDPASQSAHVEVSAYTPEDSLRLSQGVLTLSEELVNRMSDRAMTDLIEAAEREIERKREEYEAARDRLAEYQGQRFSGVDVATPAQQAMALVGSLDSQLAQKRTELATMSQTYQPRRAPADRSAPRDRRPGGRARPRRAARHVHAGGTGLGPSDRGPGGADGL
ncbi:hypothetical protein [Brevundimonas denitrificans]|uniref:hypothetical protein n=1 Tax=Brevundimonas denitrificans TaxID=1443434 RepID=UPI00223B00B7|nr:hypothetical protein [Brevundimonas denitrificans]